MKSESVNQRRSGIFKRSTSPSRISRSSSVISISNNVSSATNLIEATMIPSKKLTEEGDKEIRKSDESANSENKSQSPVKVTTFLHKIQNSPQKSFSAILGNNTANINSTKITSDNNNSVFQNYHQTHRSMQPHEDNDDDNSIIQPSSSNVLLSCKYPY